MTTKVIASACDEDGVVAVIMAEGQRHDAVPVPAGAKAAVGRVDQVLDDKAFDCDKMRGVILSEPDALPVVPNRSDRWEPRPWGEAVREACKDRNRAERGFGKAKNFRGSSTRYNKLYEGYLGLVRLTLELIHVKKTALSANTPEECHPNCDSGHLLHGKTRDLRRGQTPLGTR